MPTKTLSRGQFENPAHTLRRETCLDGNIPVTQRQRKGSGRRFDRKGPRPSSKSLSYNTSFLVRTCYRGYVDMLLLDHAIRPHICALSAQSCTLSWSISHIECRKSPFGTLRRVGRAMPCDDNNLSSFQSVAARVFKIRCKYA